jgi:predicted RND superfamily exporter protein
MLVGLVPNVVPLVLVFGLLGHLYGEVNFGAALVATAALSIAVDNTFHLIVSWTARGALREDIEAALQECLPAFQTTAMVLFAGFSVLAFSQTIPIQQFGLLLCCTLLVGLFADITILPLLLRHISRQPYEKRDQ